jgi:hypothetical protein
MSHLTPTSRATRGIKEKPAGRPAGFVIFALALLAARALVGTLVVLLSVILVAAGHFFGLGLLLVLGGFLLSLLRVALLLFAWIGAGFTHGSLLG